MPSSGMLNRVALKRTDVSDEFSIFVLNMTRISELGIPLILTNNYYFLAACIG
jgi:hypothetical protein